MWHLLGMKRLGDTLFVSIEWLRWAGGRYSLVALSLERIVHSPGARDRSFRRIVIVYSTAS